MRHKLHNLEVKTSLDLFMIIFLFAVFLMFDIPAFSQDTHVPSHSDLSSFIKAGCVKKEHNMLDCSAIALEKRFSCERILAAPDYTGSLTPKVSMAECWVTDYANSPATQKGIVKRGCRIPTFARYIVSTPEGFKLLGNMEEFAAFFAPIETPVEAISFLTAVTKDKPMYKVDYFPDVKVYIPDFKPTFADEAKEGFLVRLFEKVQCGCEHPLLVADYRLARDGKFTELTRRRVMDGGGIPLCVD